MIGVCWGGIRGSTHSSIVGDMYMYMFYTMLYSVGDTCKYYTCSAGVRGRTVGTTPMSVQTETVPQFIYA